MTRPWWYRLDRLDRPPTEADAQKIVDHARRMEALNEEADR